MVHIGYRVPHIQRGKRRRFMRPQERILENLCSGVLGSASQPVSRTGNRVGNNFIYWETGLGFLKLRVELPKISSHLVQYDPVHPKTQSPVEGSEPKWICTIEDNNWPKHSGHLEV
ncbi:hypothetical protein QUC31_016104 [Theobroma cacao]